MGAFRAVVVALTRKGSTKKPPTLSSSLGKRTLRQGGKERALQSQANAVSNCV